MQRNLIAHLIEPYLNDSNTLFMFQTALGMQPEPPLCLATDASGFNHVAVLEWWLQQSGLELKWSEYAMDRAFKNGHISVLNWWKHSDEMES